MQTQEIKSPRKKSNTKRTHKSDAGLYLNIYGLIIHCDIPSPELAAQMVRPFNYFLHPAGEKPKAEIIIRTEEIDPPYDQFPAISASFSTPRNIVFKGKDCKIIDYFGSGVIKEENNARLFTMYSRDVNFFQEAFYLLVISLFGQHCDRSKLLRIHALALSYKDTAILLPITPGGGKSTMAMAMMEEDDFKLISDDEPLLDKTGAINPFPIRIGTLDAEKISKIPEKYVYSIDRMEFGQKYFIDIEYWAEKLEKRPLKKSILFVSRRLLNGEPSIEPCSKWKALGTLVRDAVIGVGLYQGVEFLFSHSPLEVFSKIRLASGRFFMAYRLARRSQTFQISLSRNIPKNTEMFKSFIQNLPS